MALFDTSGHAPAAAASARRGDAAQAAVLFLLLYPACFTVVAVSRLAGRSERRTPRVPVWAEARAQARSSIGFVFR